MDREKAMSDMISKMNGYDKDELRGEIEIVKNDNRLIRKYLCGEINKIKEKREVIADDIRKLEHDIAALKREDTRLWNIEDELGLMDYICNLEQQGLDTANAGGNKVVLYSNLH